ncbi:MAG: cobalamin-binding protein [Dehalococcoidia bacterium]|nr:cobalamin-binding protein [Dehalococcoidia bacterium]
MRICTFLPSATEIVYLLGLGDSLHGVSHECDFPPDAVAKPKVVRSRFDPDTLSSSEIDKLVTEMMMRGENIYEVDEDTLTEAQPDLVITQQLCEVCAVSFEEVQQAVQSLDSPPEVLSLDPHGIDDVLDDILRVGAHTGRSSSAHHAVFNLRARIDSVRRSLAQAENTPTVACIEWLDPVIAAGHWIPEMVKIAGGRDVLVSPGSQSPRLDMQKLLDADPDVLVLMPCGMNVAQARAEFDVLTNRSEWQEMSAVRNGRTYVVDSGALFSRSGPRLVDGLEIMARIMHPDLFSDPAPEEFYVRL